MTHTGSDKTPESEFDGVEGHFLSDPEVSEGFDRMLNEFSRETDRGAILVAAEIVSSHLALSLQELAPFKPKRIKKLLKYPGILSSFSARADMAYMAGYISEAVHVSIDNLRSIRNEAAHSQDSFSLKNHKDRLRAICDLGPGTSIAVNRFAVETLVRLATDRAMAAGKSLEIEIGYNPFENINDVIDYLDKHPEITSTFEDRLPRMELAFGVWLLLGLIVRQRKSLLSQKGQEEAAG